MDRRRSGGVGAGELERRGRAPRLRDRALGIAGGLALLCAAACGDDLAASDTDAGSASASASGGSASASGGSDSGSATAGESCDATGQHAGEATYYDADGSGNCSFDPTPGDLMVAAINEADYAGSAPCGACAEVVGPQGTITVRIVDRCPGCAQGDLDLSPQAFEMIAPLVDGRVDIDWRFVPCAVDGPLRYRFKEGSSQWWTAVQVRNHRHAIASLEYSVDGGESFVPVARESYNYFVAPEGMGADPMRLRVTDVYGHVVVDEGVVVGDATEVAGAANFPACD
ncbi:MAG: expansin EXLX1 family cellulose-binding protein [Nannocystaceae bacterium]